MSNRSVAIIGCGAAGLMAGATLGLGAFLIDSSDTEGRKLLMSGGGKCNYTHALPASGMIEHYYDKKNFVRSAIYAFPPEDISSYFGSLGIKSRTEDNGKVFPSSGKAIDVRNALSHRCGKIFYGEKVLSIEKVDGLFRIKTDKGVHKAHYVIVSVGGNTYPQTGSDGSLYGAIKSLGHTIIPPQPSLSQLFFEDHRLKKAEGITLTMTAKKGRAVMTDSAVVTAKGISGPLAENFSHYITGKEEVTFEILRITKEEIKALPAKSMVKNALPVEKRIIGALFPELEEKRIADLTKAECEKISRDLSALELSVTVPSISAMCMRGGVSVKEIKPKTMESKIVDGLYFAGECIDVDGECGGYNISWAFSSARAAAKDILSRASSC